MNEGYELGDTCNRNGCNGIIENRGKEGSCSCHINPPCGYCETPDEFCPVCEWDANEEKRESRQSIDKSNADYYEKELQMWNKAKEDFYKKYRGELSVTEFDYRKESHSNSSMRVIGVYPEGISKEEILEKIRGTFGGRFNHFGNGRFEYIAYTD